MDEVYEQGLSERGLLALEWAKSITNPKELVELIKAQRVQVADFTGLEPGKFDPKPTIRNSRPLLLMSTSEEGTLFRGNPETIFAVSRIAPPPIDNIVEVPYPHEIVKDEEGRYQLKTCELLRLTSEQWVKLQSQALRQLPVNK